MPITIRYVCDHCGRSQDTPHQMWEVAVGLKAIENNQAYPATPKVLWCRPCCEDLNLIRPHKTSVTQPVPPPPTIESLVRALVEDLVKNALEEGRDGGTNG